MKLPAEARIALRKAITNHPKWDDVRRAENLSLASMTRDDYFRVAEILGIDAQAIVTMANSTFPGQLTSTPKDTADMQSPTIVRAAQADFAAPTPTATSAKAIAAAADFADADSKADGSTIPALPVALSDATVAKIDSIIALAVDPDVSFSGLYHTARNAIAAAHARQNALDTAAQDPRASKLATLTRPSLDFVPPSWSQDFADYVEIGSTIAVVGPAGNGKTTGAKKLLQRAGFNVYEFDCTDATLPQDLIGRTSLRQDNGATITEWTPGPIARAFADPKGAVLLNEYDALDPRTGMALQSAFEAAEFRRVTAPDSGEQITSSGPCPIVLTLNTIGHGATATYQGRNALDGANRDRIEIIVSGYESEREIMVAHGHDDSTAQRLADWAVKARKELERISSREILSNRRLLTAAALMDRCGYSRAAAVEKAFLCRLPDRDKAQFRDDAK